MTILPQLERDLFNAAQERLLPKPAPSPEEPTSLPPRAGLRRTAASVPVILSIAVTTVIAIAAIVVLSHGHQASPTTSPSRPAGGSPRAALIRTFGVLRRSQTKADLDRELLMLWLSNVGPRGGPIPPERYIPLSNPPFELKPEGYPALDRQLVRTVDIPAWTAKVLIAPTTFRPSPSSPERSEGLDLALWIGSAPTIPPSSLTGIGPPPARLSTLLAHGLALADAAPGNHALDAVYVVPDGIGSVKLGPFVSSHKTPPGVSTKALNAALGAIQATATVHDNIGAFQLAMPVVTSRAAAGPGPALDSIGAKAQAAWFNSQGHVIKQTTTEVDLIVRVQLPHAR